MQFYQQYADDNGLSLTQVQGHVSKWDLKQWQAAIDEMQPGDWPKEATNRLKAYGAVAGIDKPYLIGAIIGLGLLRMTVKHQKAIKQRVKTDGESEVKRMGTAYNMTAKQTKRITSIITQASTKELWSSNLWLDTDTLANDVENLVNKHLRHGMSLTDLQDLLAKHTNPVQFKPNQSVADRITQMQANTRRLVRSESARLVDQVNMTTYRMQGVKWVRWVCEPGACAKCQAIADAGPYPIDDCPDIPGDSHPNCRCSKVPIISVRDIIGAATLITVGKLFTKNQSETTTPMTRKNVLDRKSPVNGFAKSELRETLSDFKARGGIVDQSDDMQEHLKANGAEAMAFDADTIGLTKNPSRAAVYEELFHTKQYGNSQNDGTPVSRAKNEIEAQHYLLDNAKKLKLSKSEIAVTKVNLKNWEADLREANRKKRIGIER